MKSKQEIIIWKLQRLDLMTPTGIAALQDRIGSPDDPFETPDWIKKGTASMGKFPKVLSFLQKAENWLDKRKWKIPTGRSPKAIELSD